MLRPLEAGGFLRARIFPSVVTSSLPSISVLVLNLNGRGHLDACLSSLEAQVYPRERFEIEVVDNGSTDDSLAHIRARYPRVRLLALERNGGFCAPYNAAIQRCDSDFVALLNNDARVDPHWLSELLVGRGSASGRRGRLEDSRLERRNGRFRRRRHVLHRAHLAARLRCTRLAPLR